MIDMNRAHLLRTLRSVALLCGGLSIVALVTNLYDITWPSDVILGVAIVVFFVHAINYSADLAELRLVDDPRLRKPPKEDRMKF